MPAPKKPLRILCFGDSLTAGYHSWGTAYHPYSEMLESKLAAAFPNREVTVRENGMPGEVVTLGAFVPRLQDECKCLPYVRVWRGTATTLPSVCLCDYEDGFQSRHC